MASALIVFFDFCSLGQRGDNLERESTNAWYFTLPAKIVFGILAVTFGATIGYSRMFLGVHSLNQLIFGWSLGIWLAFTLEFIFKDSIIKNAEELLSQTNRDYMQVIVNCGALMFFAFTLEIMNYIFIKDSINNKELWK